MRNLIFLALVACCLLACEDTTSPRRYTHSPYYVITGKLEAGKPVTLERALFVGKTADAEHANINDLMVTQAEVYLRDLANNAIDSLSFGYDVTEDSVQFGYYDPDNSLIPQGGHRYRIVARIPGIMDSIWAETTIPLDLTLVPDSVFSTNPTSPYPSLAWEHSDSQHPIRASFLNSNQINLYEKYYCLIKDYQSAEWAMKIGGSGDHPGSQDEYEDPVSGWPRKIESYYRAQPQAEDGGWYITNSTYKTSVWFYGPYQITYESIDDNYYNYLYHAEGYRFGGVHNGWGYFGSSNGVVIYTEFTK